MEVTMEQSIYSVSSLYLVYERSSNKKKLGKYDRSKVLGCEPVDGVLIGLSSN